MRAEKPADTIKEFVKLIDAPAKEIIMNVAQYWMDEGKKEGEKKGRKDILLIQLQEKIGQIPAWTLDKLDKAEPSEIFRAWYVEVLKALLYYVVNPGRAEKPPDTINEFVKLIDEPAKEIIMNVARHWMEEREKEGQEGYFDDAASRKIWPTPSLDPGQIGKS